MTVDEIMTPDPITIDGSTTLGEAAATMADNDIRHLPVLERKRVVGIVSDRDLAAWLLEDLNAMLDGDDSAPLSRAVADVMSGDVLTIEPKAEISELIEVMVDARVGAIPVVDQHDERLVGIVSYVDVLRVAAEVL
jgi:CBS domain-containing protein